MIAVERAIARELKHRSFVKKSRTWRRDADEVIQVIHLQRGFGDQLFINLGVYVRSLGDEKLPLEHKCHVRSRLERVCSSEYFTPIRSLEASCEPAADALVALTGQGLAWLDLVSTQRGLRSFMASDLSRTCFVHSSVRGLCSGEEA